MDIQSCLKVLTKSELQKIATKCKVSSKSSWRKSSFVSALEKEDLDDLVQAMTSAQLTSILSENSLSSSGKVADKRDRLKTALEGGASSSKKKKTTKKTTAKKSAASRPLSHIYLICALAPMIHGVRSFPSDRRRFFGVVLSFFSW